MSQTEVQSTVTIDPPFNPPKVEELEAAALSEGGFNPPECEVVPVSDGNQYLNVLVEVGFYSPEQIDEIVAILNAVCVDPTRDELTEEQQEAADLQNKLDNVVAAITELGAINAALVAATFNDANPDTDSRIAALRGHLRNTVQDLLDVARATRYLLRMEKKRQTGVFSLTIK